MTRIAVTGYKGNIGSRLINQLGYLPLDCDVTNEVSVSQAISKMRPNIIIHLAGKSDVDYCEKLENQEKVMLINTRGTSIVFKQAYAYGATVVYLSSDHVFDGRWFGNYSERANQNPKNYYGTSKVQCEAFSAAYSNVKVVRTSTLFWGSRSFIQNPMIKVANGKKTNSPVFMSRSFMHVDHFVDQLADYCLRIEGMPKILHLSGSSIVSWYKFMMTCANSLGLDSSLVRPRYWDVSGEGIAPRPHRAGLNVELSKSLGFRQYNWLDGIEHGT